MFLASLAPHQRAWAGGRSRLITRTSATVTVTGDSNDTVRNVENVIGTAGTDVIAGDNAVNVLSGGAVPNEVHLAHEYLGQDTIDSVYPAE